MKNGGPAFPVEMSFGGDEPRGLQTGNTTGWATGMTLRDYFAAHAPNPPANWHSGEDRASDIAEWRWWYADEMLKQREPQNGSLK